MPLRTIVTLVLVVLTLQLTASTLQPAGAQQAQTSTTTPNLTAISESLPWFDHAGINLSYWDVGSYPYLNGFTHYSGTTNVEVLGIYPNGSLMLDFNSTVTSSLTPNGKAADDPFFPGYLPVLPSFMVLPNSFSVLAPGYAIFFTYKGSSTYELDGSNIPVYVYLVTASQGVGGMSAIKKYYYVSKLDGLILYENLSNPYTNSTFAMSLKRLAVPANSTPYTLQFDAPIYARPGAQLNYTVTGQPPETMVYKTLLSEKNGEFMFEKLNYVGGSPQTPAFFLDNFTSAFFYPAVQAFGQTVKMGVSLSFDAPLSYVAKTEVSTPAGKFPTYVYTNKTLGFEAYFDVQTGIAVLIEIPPPGGFIELAYSNIVEPPLPPSAIPLAVGVAAIIATLTLIAVISARRIRRGQSAYIRRNKR